MFESEVFLKDIQAVFNSKHLANLHMNQVESLIGRMASYRLVEKQLPIADDELDKLCSKLADCFSLAGLSQGLTHMKKKIETIQKTIHTEKLHF